MLNPQGEVISPQSQSIRQTPAVGGFAKTYGILPSMALLTFAVDAMLFTGEVGTLGASLPVSVGASLVLGLIVFLAQRKWYGDDAEAAFIKGLTIAFLTAIPTPLPAMLYLPAGVLGFFGRKKG